jgi:hypothetical protein
VAIVQSGLRSTLLVDFRPDNRNQRVVRVGFGSSPLGRDRADAWRREPLDTGRVEPGRQPNGRIRPSSTLTLFHELPYSQRARSGRFGGPLEDHAGHYAKETAKHALPTPITCSFPIQ